MAKQSQVGTEKERSASVTRGAPLGKNYLGSSSPQKKSKTGPDGGAAGRKTGGGVGEAIFPLLSGKKKSLFGRKLYKAKKIG